MTVGRWGGVTCAAQQHSTQQGRGYVGDTTVRMPGRRRERARAAERRGREAERLTVGPMWLFKFFKLFWPVVQKLS